MSLRRFVRRLLSLSSTRDFWQPPAHSGPNRAKLNLEMCEDRSVPASFSNLTANGTLVITINSANDGEIQVQQPVNGQVSFMALGSGNTSANYSVSALHQIIVDNTTEGAANTGITAAAQLDPTNMPGLRQVTYLSGIGPTPIADYTNFNFGPVNGSGNAPSVYFVTQFGATNTTDTYKAPGAGVSVLQFINQPVSGNVVKVDTSTAQANSMTFFDFGNLSSGVAVNLNTTRGGVLASYTNSQVILSAGTNATLYGARGGMGNNTFIASGVQNQYFIGGFGNNTFSMSGQGKTVEVASVYDLSPSLAGIAQTSGNYAGTFGLSLNLNDLANSINDIVDLTKFQNTVNTFTIVDTNAFKTASTLFGLFGMFDMGGNNPAFATALNNSITAPQLANPFNVTVNAGNANTDVFGYANVALTAVGGSGNNDFESATGALFSYLSAGSGTSLLEGNAGDTLIAGSGNTTINFFATQASINRVTRLVGGTGSGSVAAKSKFVTIDVSTGTYDLNGLINDSSVVLIYNSTTTLNGQNISANPGLIPSAVQKNLR